MSFAYRGNFSNYALIVLVLGAGWLFSINSESVLHLSFFEGTANGALLGTFFNISVIFALGFIAYELAKSTVIPSFVLAILLGYLSRDALSFITENPFSTSFLTTLGATYILFGGGLDVPFHRFKNLLRPILMLAFVATLITAFTFSFFLLSVSDFLGIAVPITAAVVLGAALSSTDPAAIIPCFKSLFFPNPRVKQMAISESGLNDVVGALMAATFLALLAQDSVGSLTEAYRSLLTMESLIHLLREIGVGVAVGFGGFYVLMQWGKWRVKLSSEGEADSALFLAIPLLCYALASAFGGSGFLAVFVAGLLFQLGSHTHHVEHFFNHSIEGFMKPLIFMILGTMVNLDSLQAIALPGIIMGLLFMFVIRPFAVFASLIWFKAGHYRFTIRELLFLSFVRETGVIPAVLLVGIKLSGIEGGEMVVSYGMLIILMTLLIQPPLTPFIAHKLGLATDVPPFPVSHKGPSATLCSRGYSFLDRLDTVSDWCVTHHVQRVSLLHCPENKFSDNLLQEVGELAKVRFDSINDRLSSEGKKELEFDFIGRPGTLEANIESMIETESVSVVFVGSKMLDYRLSKIKSLQVPFVFLN